MKKLLVDTSIWIEYFKGNKSVAAIIEDLLIYTLAKNNNCSLYTLDKHFKTINDTTAWSMDLIGL